MGACVWEWGCECGWERVGVSPWVLGAQLGTRVHVGAFSGDGLTLRCSPPGPTQAQPPPAPTPQPHHLPRRVALPRS